MRLVSEAPLRHCISHLAEFANVILLVPLKAHIHKPREDGEGVSLKQDDEESLTLNQSQERLEEAKDLLVASGVVAFPSLGSLSSAKKETTIPSHVCVCMCLFVYFCIYVCLFDIFSII